MGEIWKDVKGLEDIFIVSSYGRVKNKITGKNVRINSKRGYEVCGLYHNGKTYHRQVHRIVAEAFIPNLENKPQVHHIDENSKNNRVENLMWVTLKEHGELRTEESKKRGRETYIKNKLARKQMKLQ